MFSLDNRNNCSYILGKVKKNIKKISYFASKNYNRYIVSSILLMYTALAFMFIGMAVGILLRKVVQFSLSAFIMLIVCLLLFVLGIELGFNEELVSKFAQIGLSASIIAVFAVLCSCIAASLFFRYVVKRGGEKNER